MSRVVIAILTYHRHKHKSQSRKSFCNITVRFGMHISIEFPFWILASFMDKFCVLSDSLSANQEALLLVWNLTINFCVLDSFATLLSSFSSSFLPIKPIINILRLLLCNKPVRSSVSRS
jgi:hypothetical protein